MNIFERIERHVPIDQLSTWALAGAGCGLLAEISFLPEAARALLLLAFVLIGPGSVVLDRMGPLPLVAVRALVPVTGLSIVLLAVSGGLLLGFWSARLTLLILVALTAGGALLNRRRSAEPTVIEPGPAETLAETRTGPSDAAVRAAVI